MEFDWTDDQLSGQRLSKSRIWTLLHQIEKCDKELSEMGLRVYIADGSAHLHLDPVFVGQDAKANRSAIIATANTPRFDGGGW